MIARHFVTMSAEKMVPVIRRNDASGREGQRDDTSSERKAFSMDRALQLRRS